MFYDIYKDLCDRVGKSPTGAALEMGISKGTVSFWKNKGSVPNADTLQKIADYFGVSTDYLLTGVETKKEPDDRLDDEDLASLLQEIKDNPDLRALFSLSKDATADDIRMVLDILKRMRREAYDD